jgi:hypothetical protein
MDGQDVSALKQELLALLLAMYDRIQSLEVVQEQQNSAIQVTGPSLCLVLDQECQNNATRVPTLYIRPRSWLSRVWPSKTGCHYSKFGSLDAC